MPAKVNVGFFFYNANWNIMHDFGQNNFFLLDLHSILSDVTKWLSFELIYFFFFADFSPKFIRTKRSYLQLVGNTSSSSQNSISSLPGMKKDKQRCMHVNPCFGNFLRNEVHYDQNFKANAYIFFGLL